MNDEPIELPIDCVLDLHTFAPREVAAVVEAYLEACAQRGLREVRLIHGKGIGALRRTVHAVLERSANVTSFRLADERGVTYEVIPSAKQLAERDADNGARRWSGRGQSGHSTGAMPARRSVATARRSWSARLRRSCSAS